eukprot:c11407_g1_i2.p1 GENE.c11407_g1_i2~~c11407_g1_i2.p1  ORF type:complete len:234 (-),score=70.74 c11407_g1_i2:201-902(-)
MFKKQTFLFLFLSLTLVHSLTNCSGYTDCSSCTSNVLCAWCSSGCKSLTSAGLSCNYGFFRCPSQSQTSTVSQTSSSSSSNTASTTSTPSSTPSSTATYSPSPSLSLSPSPTPSNCAQFYWTGCESIHPGCKGGYEKIWWKRRSSSTVDSDGNTSPACEQFWESHWKCCGTGSSLPPSAVRATEIETINSTSITYIIVPISFLTIVFIIAMIKITKNRRRVPLSSMDESVSTV